MPSLSGHLTAKKITFTDNGRNLWLLDITSSSIKKVDADEMYFPGPFREMHGDWSSDSKWIVYTKMLNSFFRVVAFTQLTSRNLSL